MIKGIGTVYALVDWHNIEATVAPNFHSNPRRNLPDAILRIQQEIAKRLRYRPARHSGYRVTLRIYHGWHEERDPTPLRRDFECFCGDTSLARKIANISFTRGFQFGNELCCSSDASPLFSTYRGGGQGRGQKMVDSAIICDLLHLLLSNTADIGIILADDDDLIPALLMAQAWNKAAILMRKPGSDLSHVTDADCSANIWYWNEQ